MQEIVRRLEDILTTAREQAREVEVDEGEALIAMGDRLFKLAGECAAAAGKIWENDHADER